MVDAGVRVGPDPSSARPSRPVAMVVHAYYEEDPRVRREAESLLAAGRPVDVFALRRPGDEERGTVAGVTVHRLDVQRHQGAGLLTYLREYLSFFVRAGLALVRAHVPRRYALVQVHSLPDFLVLAALPLRLTGVPILLDLHEAMPEFFRSRFPRASNPIVHGMLELQERIAIAAASRVLTVNDSLRRRLVERGVAPAKVAVVRNSPSLVRFDAAAWPVRPFMADGVLRIVYAGALTPTYELETVIAALAELRRRRPGLELAFDLYGRGDSADRLAELAREAGLAEVVRFHGRIPIEDVPAAIAAADVGVAPTRQDRFTDASLSTKLFEYAAMGKPVVASRLPLVESSFAPGTVWTYTPGDAADLVAALLRVVDDPAARVEAVERTSALVRETGWEREAPEYVAIVEALIAAR